MGNNFQNFSRSLAVHGNNIASNTQRLSVEKQQLDLATQLNTDRDRYNGFILEIRENPNDYEAIKEKFDIRSQEITAAGNDAISGPYAQRAYQMQSQAMTTQYAASADKVYSEMMTSDGKMKIGNLLQSQADGIQSVGCGVGMALFC